MKPFLTRVGDLLLWYEIDKKVLESGFCSVQIKAG